MQLAWNLQDVSPPRLPYLGALDLGCWNSNSNSNSNSRRNSRSLWIQGCSTMESQRMPVHSASGFETVLQVDLSQALSANVGLALCEIARRPVILGTLAPVVSLSLPATRRLGGQSQPFVQGCRGLRPQSIGLHSSMVRTSLCFQSRLALPTWGARRAMAALCPDGDERGWQLTKKQYRQLEPARITRIFRRLSIPSHCVFWKSSPDSLCISLSLSLGFKYVIFCSNFGFLWSSLATIN